MEAQREPKPKAVKKEKNGESNKNSSSSSGAGGQLNSEDSQMLEVTLGMLRCSVCKDRFKNVALTRCFHLFCSECIDENLRNRHRKCPACGEKFGQDDVKSIFFTD
jgi:E3 ubiquitin-protein ligase BRE1